MAFIFDGYPVLRTVVMIIIFLITLVVGMAGRTTRRFMTAAGILALLAVSSLTDRFTITFLMLILSYEFIFEIIDHMSDPLPDVEYDDWLFGPLDKRRKKNGSSYSIFDGTKVYICKMDDLDSEYRVYMIKGVSPDCILHEDSCGSYFTVKGETTDEAKRKIQELYGIDKIIKKEYYDSLL